MTFTVPVTFFFMRNNVYLRRWTSTLRRHVTEVRYVTCNVVYLPVWLMFIWEVAHKKNHDDPCTFVKKMSAIFFIWTRCTCVTTRGHLSNTWAQAHSHGYEQWLCVSKITHDVFLAKALSDFQNILLKYYWESQKSKNAISSTSTN